MQPWTCQAGARDRHCDTPPSYRYLYRSTNPAAADLLPYDPAQPPADVATTTVNGAQVPYIVRVETSYLDRDQYAIAVLFRPGQALDRGPAPGAVHPQDARHPRSRLRHRLRPRAPHRT